MAYKNIKIKTVLTEAAGMRRFIVHESDYSPMGGSGEDVPTMRLYSAKSILNLLLQLQVLDPTEHAKLPDEDALHEFEMSNGDGQPYYTIAELKGNRLIPINY